MNRVPIRSLGDLPREKQLVTKQFNLLLNQIPESQYRQIDAAFVDYYNRMLIILLQEGAEVLIVAIYQLVDNLLTKQIQNSTKPITCLKNANGCSWCCYINVDLTEPEAKVAFKYAQLNGIKIDWDLVLTQAQDKDLEVFRKLSHAQRKCAFLQEDGSCGVYEARPLACRAHYVVTPVEDCRTDETVHKTLDMYSLEVEMVRSVAMVLLVDSNDMDHLPFALLKIREAQKSGLPAYCIYEHPLDYPDKYVVRVWRNNIACDGPFAITDTLEQARATVPRGLIAVRTSDDDTAIVETYI